MTLHLRHFPFRHHHKALQLVQCHCQWVQHRDSEFSVYLRAHCSAILVPRLLRVLRKNVGVCGVHLSAPVEIENVVFGIHGNELVSSMPVHQFLKMRSSSLTHYAVNRNHVATVMSQIEILSSFARDLCSTTQHLVYTNKSYVQRSEQTVSS